MPGRYHFFQGGDPTHWRTDVQAFERIRYDQIRPGVDLELQLFNDRLTYEILLGPGVDSASLRFRVRGAEGLRIGASGELLLDTALGTLIQAPPLAWSEHPDGSRTSLTCGHSLSSGRLGFVLPDRDPELRTVIAPGLAWSSFLGSSAGGAPSDVANAVTVDALGRVTVVGHGAVLDFPTTPGAFVATNGSGAAFVTRFAPRGNELVFSCVIGGSGAQTTSTRALAVDVDVAGRTLVGGRTSASDFPITAGALSTSLSGAQDGFVLVLAEDGSRLDYSTFLGGGGGESVQGLAFAPSGAAVVAGEVVSNNGFPTTGGAFDTTPNGATDAFVARIDPTGSSLEWSTLLGGSLVDVVEDLALGADESVTVVGRTSSSNFPVTPGAFDTSFDGALASFNGFAARLAPGGGALVWSTLLDGGFGETFGECVAVDAFGRAVVGGSTFASQYPVTTNAWDPAFDPWPVPGVPQTDGFVTCFDATGSFQVYSSFVGASGGDEVTALDVDASGVVSFGGTSAGTTTSSLFQATPGATQESAANSLDFFVGRLSPDGARLDYLTWLGGGGSDELHGLALARDGSVVVAGVTGSLDFPTTAGALGSSFQGGQNDAAVARLAMLPLGAKRLGTATSSCLGDPILGVSEKPVEGAVEFVSYCSAAPIDGTGALLLGFAPAAAPIHLAGAELWIDPGAGLVVLPASTDGAGFAETPLPLPPATAGLRFLVQYVFVETGACAPGVQLAASGAVEITVQS